ncbi:MAG: UDP-3-O-(3-hydroxymyristoyl)glucosamine N-acyltransferase [Planctomycetes bacterium]|nr:UDP-3-O-(3-hydroxymyristoyl)glucosamine N-acyltransferase [Planctomycetota bacterium]
MSDAVTITADELARRLGARLEGNGARTLRDVATLESAGPDDLSWIADEQLVASLAASRAGAVLVQEGLVIPAVEPARIMVPDADAALCDVLRWLGPPPIEVSPGVHPTATVAASAHVEGAAVAEHVHIADRARVGVGTQLHPGVHVGAESTIGRDCVLWPNVVVRERCIIGNRVIIHPNATIGADGFGYLQRDGKHRKIPQIGIVVIEDDVEIGANSTIDRARSGVTRIGRGTKIDNLVQVAHNVEIGENCILIALSSIGGSSTLGHHVILSGHAAVSDHVQLGNEVRVTGMSGVARNAADGETLRGLPATEYHLYMRQRAALRKLPKLLERVRGLTHRIEELESAANDTTRS